MIQYSNINDAWGNKEIFKKNILNNSVNIDKPVAPIVPPNSIEIEPKTLAPVVPPATVFNPATIVPPTTVSNHMPNFAPPYLNSDVLTAGPINKKETFTHDNSCSFAEHLKVCDECRNSMYEYFKNNNTARVSLLGSDIYISKDFLKILFTATFNLAFTLSLIVQSIDAFCLIVSVNTTASSLNLSCCMSSLALSLLATAV
jgi:hypothetical protein